MIEFACCKQSACNYIKVRVLNLHNFFAVIKYKTYFKMINNCIILFPGMYYMKQSLIKKREHFKFFAYVGLSAHICTYNVAHKIRSYWPYSLTRKNCALNLFTTPCTRPSTIHPCEILLIRN